MCRSTLFEMEGGAQSGAWRPDDQSNFSALELDRYECLDLQRHVRIRRLVLSVDCLPAALPVNMSVLDEDVNFSTGTCSIFNAAVDRQVVSLEADDVDSCDHTGWSVLVTGVAQLVTDCSVAEWTRARLQPPAPGPHRFLIKVPRLGSPFGASHGTPCKAPPDGRMAGHPDGADERIRRIRRGYRPHWTA
jgi:hypothetical protein